MENHMYDDSEIQLLIRHFVDNGTVAQSREPEIVILTGSAATGKTTIRRQKYSKGYVILDPAELFLTFCGGAVKGFPGEYDEPLRIIGFLIANQAVAERRDIVTEMIANDELTGLIDAMLGIDYHVRVYYIHCVPEESWRRNISRGVNNISAYYAQRYNIDWLMLAARNYKALQNNR